MSYWYARQYAQMLAKSEGDVADWCHPLVSNATPAQHAAKAWTVLMAETAAQRIRGLAVVALLVFLLGEQEWPVGATGPIDPITGKAWDSRRYTQKGQPHG